MQEVIYQFGYTIYSDSREMDTEDADLVAHARAITTNAYAPYSQFRVGAAALLTNKQIITGTNQENASYPVGICAERVLLSAVSATRPGDIITSIAISYHNVHGQSVNPIAPCGLCRQSLLEYEVRQKTPIRILLTGQSGEVYLLNRVTDLLPLHFSGDDMA
jgi:cytidine deaminase